MKTIHRVNQSLSFFCRAAVILRKRQTPVVDFRFRLLKAILHLHPVSFKHSRLV